jgi:hypothetical protein
MGRGGGMVGTGGVGAKTTGGTEIGCGGGIVGIGAFGAIVTVGCGGGGGGGDCASQRQTSVRVFMHGSGAPVCIPGGG